MVESKSRKRILKEETGIKSARITIHLKQRDIFVPMQYKYLWKI
jgi:hypothetical protein